MTAEYAPVTVNHRSPSIRAFRVCIQAAGSRFPGDGIYFSKS